MNPYRDSDRRDPNFTSQPTRWTEKGSQSKILGLRENPSQLTGVSLKEELRSNPLSRLVPNWNEKRKMFHIKTITLMRFYLSKWFYEGLEFHEQDLLLMLLSHLKIEIPVLDMEVVPPCTVTRNHTGKPQTYDYSETLLVTERSVKGINLVGITVVMQVKERDYQKSFNLKGWELLEWEIPRLEDLVYSENDFKAIKGLRSLQSLRDTIFQPMTIEQSGKEGIKRVRQRGYTDGRGGSPDSRRIRLARQLDQLYWTEKHEKRWDEFFTDLEGMCLTHS